MMIGRRSIINVFFGMTGLLSFATVALSEDVKTQSEQAVSETGTTSQFLANGSAVNFDQNRASIIPITGWQVEPKTIGMSLVMREVHPENKSAPVDYSKPLFSRNMTVMTINESSPIDEMRAEAFQEEFAKMATRDGVMKEFQFTSRKFFNYKGENDGIVFFAQHTANGFPMMQMMVLVSGESKQYLSIYTDLANQFSNQESYDAAWKSMTSIMVQGIAPIRYVKEAKILGAIVGGILLVILPFGFARFSSQRRIRRMVDDLQKDWDSGLDEVPATVSNYSHLGMTRVAGFGKEKKGAMSSISSIESDSRISTKKRAFSQVNSSAY